MKFYDYAKARLRGIYSAVVRYWTVFLLLLAATVLNGIAIGSDSDFERHIMALIFGAFCFLLAHALGERFGKSSAGRSLYLVAALLATAAYYVYILNVREVNDVVTVKTITLIFALSVAFILTPSLGRETDFNAVFLSVFKAFFISVFFSGIIHGGIYLILIAIDNLLVNLGSDTYRHLANIVWVLLAPMLMLSLIPVFSGGEKNAAKLVKATGYPKFLDILLSYVLIPLASVYTLVLVIYMGKTVAVGDWTDNLLEPMLLTYLIAVLVIYVLVKRLGNTITKFFARVFPAFITVIAAFQLIASVIKAADEGVVAARYFVLMFSVYSIIVGALLFLRPNKRNGYVGALAVAFALVCAAPAVGAFDVSIRNQAGIVEGVLEDNGMLDGGAITPKSDLSDDDKIRLARGISYLESVDALGRLEFLPDGFSPAADFYKVFGFDSNGGYPFEKGSKFYSIDEKAPVSVAGYDYFISSFVNFLGGRDEEIAAVSEGGREYKLKLTDDNGVSIVLFGESGVLLEAPLGGVWDTLNGYDDKDSFLDASKLTFDFENGSAKVRLIFKSVSIYTVGEMNMDANVIILFSIK